MIFSYIKSIKQLLLDKTVSIWKKILVITGIIYLLSPFEILPDFIFPFGFLDDIFLWVMILSILGKSLKKYNTTDSSKKYKGKDIIEDVVFEVEEN